MKARTIRKLIWMWLTKCKDIHFDNNFHFASLDIIRIKLGINLFYRDRGPKVQPPAFLKKIGDTEVYEGMKARFTACATGWPEPDVEWFLNGDRIYANDRTIVDIEPNGLLRLTVKNVTPADVGKYTCRVHNPHGEDTCSAELLYDSKPNKKLL